MAAPVRGSVEAGREAPGALALALSCPKCAAPFEADDGVVTVGCEHCGSLLTLAAPDREEVYLADGVVERPEQLLAIVVLYRAQAQRAEIVAHYSDSDGNPPSEEFIEARLAAFATELRRSARLLEAHRLHAPYGHVSGAIVQGILGRRRGGAKVVQVRAFGVEHSVPAYDAALANLRDRGLRLGGSRVRPLRSAEVPGRGLFLPSVPVESRPHREIERWRTQDLDRELEAVAKHGAFCAGREILVYRPYWVVRAATDEAPRWMLIDGAFGTIAGYPDAGEAAELLALGTRDPLRSGEESFRRVRIIASRCPDCGHEHRFDPRSHVEVCRSCHLALEPLADGIRVRAVAHVDPDGHPGALEYLPFWRCRLQGSLEDHARALFAQAPPRFHPAGSSLWIPAFRLLGTAIGDETFRALAESTHGAPPEVHAGKVPLGRAESRFRGVTVDEGEARTLAPFALLGLHTTTSAARLNGQLFGKAIGLELAAEGAELVLVPFRRAGKVLERPGVKLPLVLLDGGPELAAQRATVYGVERRAGRS